jgi:hypothetical protein
MCEGHEEHHGHRGRGFRGFGRRGTFPPREAWLEHLQAQRQRLAESLANVDELIRRLEDPPTAPPAAPPQGAI